VAWTLVKGVDNVLRLEETVKSDGSRRTVRFPAAAAAALAAHREQWGDVHPHVWANPVPRLRRKGDARVTPGGLPHPDSIAGPLERACRAANLALCDCADDCVTVHVPVMSPHGLRHSAATIALAAGAESRVVMDILGHVDPRMMAHYQHVVEDSRVRATDAIDAAWGDEAAS
jgi:integrase